MYILSKVSEIPLYTLFFIFLTRISHSKFHLNSFKSCSEWPIICPLKSTIFLLSWLFMKKFVDRKTKLWSLIYHLDQNPFQQQKKVPMKCQVFWQFYIEVTNTYFGKQKKSGVEIYIPDLCICPPTSSHLDFISEMVKCTCLLDIISHTRFSHLYYQSLWVCGWLDFYYFFIYIGCYKCNL